MKNRFHKRSTTLPLFALLSGTLLILFGLVFALSAQPAQANPLAQGYPVATSTATQSGTLPPPSVTGTPTVLFPVTGADLTQPSGPQGTGVGVWIALWLIGLLLIGFGVRSKLWKQK